MSARATASVHDLSDEETEELLNFGRGEGYLIADQARIPMVVMASEKEKEIYNTDPGLEVTYRKLRRSNGRANSSGMHPEVRPESEADADRETPMRTYAFSGDGASETAAAMVRLLGRDARRQGKHVLAVDACGGTLTEGLGIPSDTEGSRGVVHLDEFLLRRKVDAEGLGGYLTRSASPAVWCAESPQDVSLPSFALKETAREVFDLCIVACPVQDTDNPYAEDWLLGADAVVGCSSTNEDDALRSALVAEELRGRNGTLLAVSGGTGGLRSALPDGHHPRPVHRLTASASGDISQDRNLKELALALNTASIEGKADG